MDERFGAGRRSRLRQPTTTPSAAHTEQASNFCARILAAPHESPFEPFFSVIFHLYPGVVVLFFFVRSGRFVGRFDPNRWRRFGVFFRGRAFCVRSMITMHMVIGTERRRHVFGNSIDDSISDKPWRRINTTVRTRSVAMISTQRVGDPSSSFMFLRLVDPVRCTLTARGRLQWKRAGRNGVLHAFVGSQSAGPVPSSPGRLRSRPRTFRRWAPMCPVLRSQGCLFFGSMTTRSVAEKRSNVQGPLMASLSPFDSSGEVRFAGQSRNRVSAASLPCTWLRGRVATTSATTTGQRLRRGIRVIKIVRRMIGRLVVAFNR